MAEVEILLGTRNGAAYLGPQLASFAGQSLTDWTLRVSDDGSQDATRLVLGRFSNARPGCRMTLTEGPGAGLAANYLALIAGADPRARYLALSDQDDIWFPEKLSRAVSALRRAGDGRPVMYAAQTVLIDQNGMPVRRRHRKLPTPSFENALVQNTAAGNTIVMNRSAARLAVAAMPKSLPPFHDWWLYALIAGAGGRIIVDDRPVLAYRQHRAGILGAHHGLHARLLRAKLLAGGTWRRWLAAHHAALWSVRDMLLPEHRARLRILAGDGPRLEAYLRVGARRQSPAGTAAMQLAALARLA